MALEDVVRPGVELAVIANKAGIAVEELCLHPTANQRCYSCGGASRVGLCLHGGGESKGVGDTGGEDANSVVCRKVGCCKPRRYRICKPL